MEKTTFVVDNCKYLTIHPKEMNISRVFDSCVAQPDSTRKERQSVFDDCVILHEVVSCWFTGHFDICICRMGVIARNPIIIMAS